jgi:hypothetical protein
METEEELRSAGWPATLEEMDAHLKRIIPLLQRGPLPFYDPGLDHWYCYAQDAPRFSGDPEKLCKPAYLHVERWVNEETREEIWALTALREGWRPPDKAIEGAVLGRVTSSRIEEYTLEDLDDVPPGDEDGDFVF